MKFGIREICNVTFRAKSEVKIGSQIFMRGQPVIYLDSAKTSTLEGAATSVYATGGRGNTRLVTWEGEKTLTFTVEDALISPVGLSVLSGAGLIKSNSDEELVHVHKVVTGETDNNGLIDITDALTANEKICATAPLFVLAMKDGDLTGSIYDAKVDSTGKKITVENGGAGVKLATVMVDFYVQQKKANVTEIQIDAENFAGYYYVEAETLFRAQASGVDYPAIITLPNVKIQSNFSFSMASSGDPSTFTFTMDAMPGYTYFDKTKQVLCVIQVVEDATVSDVDPKSVMEHKPEETAIKITGKGDEKDYDSFTTESRPSKS